MVDNIDLGLDMENLVYRKDCYMMKSLGEGNYYYDIKKCGIGFHGDAERRKVVGIRLGDSIPLHFQWFLDL